MNIAPSSLAHFRGPFIPLGLARLKRTREYALGDSIIVSRDIGFRLAQAPFQQSRVAANLVEGELPFLVRVNNAEYLPIEKSILA